MSGSLLRATFASIALSLSWPQDLWGNELPLNFVTVRPAAVGGAFTAISNDENAIWTNPAGIARNRKARSRKSVYAIKSPSIIVGANSKSREFIGSVANGGSASDISKIGEEANNIGDKPFWANSSISGYTIFNLGGEASMIGVYSHTLLSSVLDPSNSENAMTEVKSDVGGVWGIAFSNSSNRFSIGISTRYLARYAFEDSVPVSVLADASSLQGRIKAQSNKSVAIGLDTGLLWTLADFWFPTFGIAMLNLPTGCRDDYLNSFSKRREKVCGTNFRGDFANLDAASRMDPTDLRIGVSISPRLSRGFSTRIALDVHNIVFSSGENVYGLSEVDTIKKLHFGIEFFAGNPLNTPDYTFAFGMNQGFYTYGLTSRVGILDLQFASIGQDISRSDSPEEDRRYLGGVSLKW